MRQKSGPPKEPPEKVVGDIRGATRERHLPEEKIRIVPSGLRGKDRIAEPCRREGIAQSLNYSWSQEFLEAGKTDFTYLKVIGWGWFCLSTVLDDFSRVRRGLEPVAARASLSPGSSAPRCARATSPILSSRHSKQR